MSLGLGLQHGPSPSASDPGHRSLVLPRILCLIKGWFDFFFNKNTQFGILQSKSFAKFSLKNSVEKCFLKV